MHIPFSMPQAGDKEWRRIETHGQVNGDYKRWDAEMTEGE